MRLKIMIALLLGGGVLGGGVLQAQNSASDAHPAVTTGADLTGVWNGRRAPEAREYGGFGFSAELRTDDGLGNGTF